MNFQEIISISGKPGLHRIISTTKSGVVAEHLETRKKTVAPLFSISALSDIVIFTEDDDIQLLELFKRMHLEHEKGTEPPKPKSSASEHITYFEKVLPNYDRQRFLNSHMKKVLQWYHILHNQNLFPSILEEDKSE